MKDLINLDFSEAERRIACIPVAEWTRAFSTYQPTRRNPAFRSAFAESQLTYLLTYLNQGTDMNTKTIPELTLDNGFVIPAVTVQYPDAFRDALRNVNPSNFSCPQIHNADLEDADALGDALQAEYGSSRLDTCISWKILEAIDLHEASQFKRLWIDHAIKALSAQEHDYSLCRKPLFGDYLYDTELLCFDPGSMKEPYKKVTYLCAHPSDADQHILKLTDGSRGPIHKDYIYLPPLTWVEGKPVYKGDTLYAKPDSFAYKNLRDFQGPLVVERVTGAVHDMLALSNGNSLHVKDATWELPVPVVRDKNGEEIKVGDEVWYQPKDGYPIMRLTINEFKGSYVVSTNYHDYGLAHISKAKPTPYININGFKVPEPMREVPGNGTRYYVVDLCGGDPSLYRWDGGEIDREWLALGILHFTKEAAVAHRDALLSLTKTK